MVLSVAERRDHLRIGTDSFPFQPLRFDARSRSDQQSDHFALTTMISGGWLAPAMDRPSQGRRVVLLISQVDVRPSDQFGDKSVLAKQRGPVERGFTEHAAEVRFGSGGQQPEPNLFGSETRGSDQGRVAVFPVLPAPLEVQVGTSVKQRINQGNLLPHWQRAFKQHVRNEVERMGEARFPFSPADEFVGARRILGQELPKCSCIPVTNCGLHVHAFIIERQRLVLEPKRLKPAELEATARMVEMMLDGLLMGMAASDSPDSRALSRRAWERFVNLLLKDRKP